MNGHQFTEALMDLRADALEARANEFLTHTDPVVEVLHGIRLACETLDGLAALVREIPPEHHDTLHRLMRETHKADAAAKQLRRHTFRHLCGLPIEEDEG